MTYPIFKDEADILATTYYHRADVLRPQAVVDEMGYDDFKDVKVYENLECAVSFSQGSTADITDTTQPINYIAILHARPEVKILSGDIIKADVLGNPYVFRAGEGVVWQSHIEVPLIRKDDA